MAYERPRPARYRHADDETIAGPSDPGRRSLTERLTAARTVATIARKTTEGSRSRSTVPDVVKRAIASERGTLIDDPARWSLQVGADVSHARIVQGPAAASAAAAIDARAFTVGDRIFFGAGVTPETDGGAVLRHELIHTVQQKGAAIGSVDDLQLTSDHDHVEQEARAGEKPAAPSGAAIARDPVNLLSFDAKMYVLSNAADIASSLNARLATLELPLRSAYSSWATSGIELGKKAFGEITAAQVISDLAGWLGGQEVLHRAVTKGRELWDETDRGGLVWRANVGTEIANVLIKLIADSLARMLPRYERARARAAIEAEKTQKKCLIVAPEPASDDIIRSHPFDKHVVKALVAGTIKFDLEGYRKNHTDLDVEDDTWTPDVELLAPKGTWFWARVKGTRPVTVEQVALALYGTTEYATEVTPGGGSLYGFTRKSALLQHHKDKLAEHGADPSVPESTAYPTAKGSAGTDFQPWQLDPAKELLKSPMAEEAALAQASKYGATGASKEEIVKRLHEIKSALAGAAANAKIFGLDTRLAEVQTDVESRAKKVEAGDAGEAMKWDAHSSKQLAIVKAASDGVASAVKQLSGLTDIKTDHGALKLGNHLRMPLRDLAEQYVTVAAQSFLVEMALGKLAAAEQRLAQFPLELMEAILRDLVTQIQRVASGGKAGSLDPDGLRKKEEALRLKLSQARVDLIKNPVAIQLIISELSAELEELQTEVAIAANIDSLDRAMGQVRDQVGFWNSVFLREYVIAEKYLKLLGAWVQIWEKIKADFYSGDDAKKAEAIKLFKKVMASEEYPDAYQQAARYCADAAAWNIVAQVLGVIAITVLSMGIGAWVGGAVTGALGGAGAAGAGATAGATTGAIAGMSAATVGFIAGQVTEAAIQAVFLAEEKTFAGIAKEFVWNLALMGALKKMTNAYREIKAVKAAMEAGKKGMVIAGEASIQFVSLGIAASARAEIEARMKGKELSDKEVKHILAQHTGMFIAMMIAGRAAGPILKELEIKGMAFGAKVENVNALRAALAAKAKAIKITSEADLEAELKPLIEQDAAELKAELELYKDLKNHPDAMKAAGLTPDEIKLLQAGAESALKEVKVTEAMMKARHSSGSDYEVSTRGALDDIVSAHKEDGGSAEKVGTDEKLGTETWQITNKKGEVVRIILRAEAPAADSPIHDVAKAKDAPEPTKTDGPPKVDDAALPTEQQDLARWTTDKTDGKADIWATKAENGQTFKDAYARWVKEGMPVEPEGDGFKAKLPEGTAKEFAPLFAKIVAEPSFRATVIGGEKIAALKAKGIDLAKIDPQSPEYLKMRPELEAVLGKDGLAKYEATMTSKPGDPARAEVDAHLAKAVGEKAIGLLKSTFPDCEIILTGESTKVGTPLDKLKGLEVILIAPDGAPHDAVVGLEKRASELKVETTKEVVEAGGPGELPVKARAMTKEQYLGIRASGKDGAQGDVRVDDLIKDPSTEQVGKGFDAARGQVDDRTGNLPKEVIDLITKNLPGIKIDPANPRAGIEAYIKAQFPGAKDLQITGGADGKSGAEVFFIKDGDKTIGVFKIFRSPTEMAREIASLQKLKDLNLTNMEPVGIGKAANLEGGKPGSAAIMEPAKGDFVKSTIKDAGAASGPARVDAISKLSHDVKAVGRALAELHAKSASGEKVSAAAKEDEIKWLKDKWTRASAKMSPKERAAIAPVLEQLYADFRAADLDASLAHGDGHAGNFAVQKNGKVSVIDTETLYRSVGDDSKGTASGTTDVGRFMESIRTFGAEANLSPAEIAKLQGEFMATYRQNLETFSGKPPASGIEVGTRFYQANLDLIAYNGAQKELADLPATASKEERAAAQKKVEDAGAALKASLGLPSKFTVAPEGLDVTPAQAKAFEEWLGSARLSPKEDLNTEYMKRLRDYYGRDPAGAIQLATKEYGFGGGTPADAPAAGDGPAVAPETARAEAERMLKYLEHADPEFKNGKKLSADELKHFIDKYEAGYLFDPLSRRWYLPGGATKDKPVFPKEGYSADDVFEVLMGRKPVPVVDAGTGTTPAPKFETSFKVFVEMLARAGVEGGDKGKIEARIKKAIKTHGWKDEYVETVRHEVKGEFRKEVVQKLANPDVARLQELYPDLDWTGNFDAAYAEARFQHMRKALDPLESSDRGNLAESWNAEVKGITDPSLRHTVVTPESAAQAGLDGVSKNILDMVKGDEIVDSKDYSGSLEGSEAQLEQQLKIAGKETGKPTALEVADRTPGAAKDAKKTVTIRKVRWSITDPRGVKASAEWMADMVDANPDHLVFELHNWKGETRTVPGDFSTGDLRSSLLEQWLGKPPDLTKP